MTCHKVGQKFAGQQVVADGSYQSKLTDWNHMGLFVFRRPVCKRRSDGGQTNLSGFDKTDWDKKKVSIFRLKNLALFLKAK